MLTACGRCDNLVVMMNAYFSGPSAPLGLGRGDISAIIGCGGKTSLLYALAAENRASSVLIGATARIFRPPDDIFDRAVHTGETVTDTSGVTLAFAGEENGKLLPSHADELARLCPRFDHVFLECDGSRGLPLKGWNDREPVIPEFCTSTVGVAVVRPVGQRLSDQLVLRPERFCALTGADTGDIITPGHIAAMISHPDGMMRNAKGRIVLFINQIESEATEKSALEMLELLPDEFTRRLSRVVFGSVRQRRYRVVWE